MKSTFRLLAVASIVLLPWTTQAQVQSRAAPREFSRSGFAISVDGGPAIGIPEVSGGYLQGEVTEQRTADGGSAKQIGRVGVSSMTFDWDLSTDLLNWISQTVNSGALIVSNVTIFSIGGDGQAQARRDYTDTAITGVAFPALDSSSKESGRLKIRLAPSNVQYRSGGAVKLAPSTAARWAVNNFRLELENLPTGRVAAIEPFTWTMTQSADIIGNERASTSPPSVAIENLKLSVSAADFAPWQDWMENFLVRGETGPNDELTGSLIFLGPDLVQELMTVELRGVGLVSLGTPMTDASGASTFDVELYVESIRLLGN